MRKTHQGFGLKNYTAYRRLEQEWRYVELIIAVCFRRGDVLLLWLSDLLMMNKEQEVIKEQTDVTTSV